MEKLGAFSSVIFAMYYWSYQIKKNDLDGACSTFGRDKCILSFGGEIDGKMKYGRPEHKLGNNKGLSGCRKWGKKPWTSVLSGKVFFLTV